MPLPSDPSLSERHYRAPAADGEILCIPEFSQVIIDAERNARELNCSEEEIAEMPLSVFRRQARHEVITLAVDWTNRLTGDRSACADCAHDAAVLYVTGHQPQLAHPGVWAKNFATSALAKASRGVGLNIIVDNDTVGTQSIRVPTGDRHHPRMAAINYDVPQPQQPWEELTIVDEMEFRTFGQRVTEIMAHWGIRPLINQMWETAVEHAQTSQSIAQILSACRIAQERRWGGNNLEIPLSVICQSTSFLNFVSHLIRHAENFHSSYNRIVEDYRQFHRIRNNRHPVPNLARSGEALELPLWYWEPGDATRGQVFVRKVRDKFELICRDRVLFTASGDSILGELQSLQTVGKLRTRALTTTLFSRLCFADLFIHGIGGAKYDEMTDRLINEFFGQSPPSFLVLSATCHLPIDPFDVTPHDQRQLARQIRDLKYNADRHLSGIESVELQREKTELIKEQHRASDTRLSKAEFREKRMQRHLRHAAFKRVNAALSNVANEQKKSLQDELAVVRSQLQANAIFQSREFSAVLFPTPQIERLVHRFNTMAESAASTV